MRAFVPVLIAVLSIGALTACGSTTASSTPTAPATAAAPAGDSPGTTAGDDTAAAGVLDVCALMPASKVATMAGRAVTVATADVTSGPDEHMCLYSDADGGNAMSLWVNATSGPQAYEADLASVGSGAKQVDGVGDKAFTSVLGLEVLEGTTLIKVTGVDDVAAASELAKTLARQL